MRRGRVSFRTGCSVCLRKQAGRFRPPGLPPARRTKVFGWTSAPACAGCGGEARWRRRGVDVGAIVEIPELIQRLADEGKAVVVISSYLPEIMALSDRILVSRQGKVVEEFSALEATEEKIMYAAVH
jgi:hypothetical protein